MNERLVALAVPVFFLAMILEFLLNRRHLARTGQRSPTGGIGGYRFADTLANLGGGIGQQALDPILRVAQVAAYAFVFEHFALTRLDPAAPATWVFGMLGVDCLYYWFHRASHRVNALWAVHHVHHSSEEYNYAVALRQPWLEKLVDLPFYLPLALLGLPVEVYLGCFTLNLLYQFFVHTRYVPKLGPLEWLLSTPSAHRVHHAVNPVYIDKNYGGILIVWDRLFGTFAPEREAPVFGTVKPLGSWSAPWANAVVWTELWRASRSTRRLRDKLALWVAPPEWRPADLGGPVTIPPPRQGVAYDPPLPRGARAYALLSFAALNGMLVAFLGVQAGLQTVHHVVFALLAVAWLAAVGGALEGRRWTLPLSLAVTAGLAVAWPLWIGWPLAVVAGLAGAVVALGLLARRVKPVPA